MKLSYTRSGNPNSAAIVFLHGMAMGQWMWYDQTQYLADYDCYTVDLPGHGGSNQIAWDSFDQTADCVAQLIAEDIPDKLVYLVGMSLGAVVGLHLVTRYPQHIERAILTGAFAAAPPRWLIMLQGRILSAILSTPFGRQMFARSLQLPSEAMPCYEQSINALSIPSFRRIVQQIADYTPLDGLEAVTVPLLFVTGEKDVAVNRRSVTRLAQRVPGAVGVYAPGVHHGWNGEDPALFNEMIRAWIEGQPLPQRLIPAVTEP
jgi:pimeloyl-ACP methyl ester carboxylesterase